MSTTPNLLDEGIGLTGSAVPASTNGAGNGAGPKRSQAIGTLVAALCKAQLEFGPVVKSNINPQFRSKYADLATIINATMPALAKNGLAVIQTPHVNGRELTMTTMLVHSSGEWIVNELTLPATMRNELTAQTIGSACTYSRRYALQSLLGISAEPDDDGQEASGGGSKEAAQAVAQEKIAEFKAKKEAAKPAQSVLPCLFYAWSDETQSAIITGDSGLMAKSEDLLKPLLKGTGKNRFISANDDELNILKLAFEDRGVPFRPLQPHMEAK